MGQPFHAMALTILHVVNVTVRRIKLEICVNVMLNPHPKKICMQNVQIQKAWKVTENHVLVKVQVSAFVAVVTVISLVELVKLRESIVNATMTFATKTTQAGRVVEKITEPVTVRLVSVYNPNYIPNYIRNVILNFIIQVGANVMMGGKEMHVHVLPRQIRVLTLMIQN